MPTVTNTDDFLVRHLKGCIQLGSAPIIPNGINMVPVNHVARCVVACAFHPPSSTKSSSTVNVAQVTANPRLTFTQFTDVLNVYGYGVDSVPYEEWKQKLVGYVEKQQQEEQEGKEEHALMPLYHFVTGSSPFPFLSAPYISSSIPTSTIYSIPISLPSLARPLSTLHPTHPSIHPNPHLTSTGDLPSTTHAPLLSDTNTQTALLADSATTTTLSSQHSITSSPYPSVTPEVVGLYIA
ncbi:MAG: hypothetical protein Q9215_005926, partial [Flavoplaca cf. flavocitrina]